MKLPAITGIIRRRVLLNYRVAPETVAKLLPKPFRPKLVNGQTIAGICLIRLEEVRPKGFPKLFGLSSDNSAHRFAVEWEDDTGQTREGVYVPRRDTQSKFILLTGGRVFPGVHSYCDFDIQDQDGEISFHITPRGEQKPLLSLELEETDHFPEDSIFSSIEESSRFFENGSLGYSARPNSCVLEGLLLKVPNWQVSPLKVHHAQSAYFGDTSLFPADQIQLDHALLMRDIDHEWQTRPSITSETEPAE